MNYNRKRNRLGMFTVTKCITAFLIVSCLPVISIAQSQETFRSKYLEILPGGVTRYIVDERGNILPDFSNVGYRGNKTELPLLPVTKTIDTTMSTDHQSLIQSTLDEIAKLPVDRNGFRGVLLLKAGTWFVPGTIRINQSGIIIRGENGTRVIATGTVQRTLFFIGGKGKVVPDMNAIRKITDHYVPVGAKSFWIESTKGLKVGDSILIRRPGTEQWISDIRMDRIEVRDSTTRQWPAKEYDLYYERVITKINGKEISVDNPVVMAMEDKYGGGEIIPYSFPGRIMNSGIENIVCISEFTGPEDEAHGWDAVSFNRIAGGWAKNIIAIHFGYSCVNLGADARNITVTDCSYLQPKSKITGSRRYSFNNDGQLNLVMNCYAEEGRHDYVTGAKVCGPNVFYNCVAVKSNADIGPHHRWATGTLYDNIITDGEINVQDRGNWGTGHGWAGANQVIWNCKAKRAAIQDPYSSAKNYVIGLAADTYPGRFSDRPMSVWDHSQPSGAASSLYLLQLKDAMK